MAGHVCAVALRYILACLRLVIDYLPVSEFSPVSTRYILNHFSSSQLSHSAGKLIASICGIWCISNMPPLQSYPPSTAGLSPLHCSPIPLAPPLRAYPRSAAVLSSPLRCSPIPPAPPLQSYPPGPSAAGLSPLRCSLIPGPSAADPRSAADIYPPPLQSYPRSAAVLSPILNTTYYSFIGKLGTH